MNCFAFFQSKLTLSTTPKCPNMVTAIAEDEYCNAVTIDGNGNKSNAHLLTIANNAELKQ